MTVAQTLEVVHGLMNNVKIVMNGTQRLLGLLLAQLWYCHRTRRQSINGRLLEGFGYVYHLRKR